jgi:hypothetical protein
MHMRMLMIMHELTIYSYSYTLAKK